MAGASATATAAAWAKRLLAPMTKVSKLYFGLSRLVSSPRVPGEPVPGRTGSGAAAAAEAGARAASFVLLRLPLAVRPVFLEWLERTEPLKYQRIVARIRDTRGGELNDGRYGKRMRGEGLFAGLIAQRFAKAVARLGLAETLPALRCSAANNCGAWA